jgi:NADPH-dependent ferric siderophore reductase
VPTFSDHAMTIVSRMDGVVALRLTVAALEEVTPSLRSVRLHGELSTLRPLPGQDVMVSVTEPDGRHRWRRYTIRDLGPDALELWVTTDTPGPGAAWASRARTGDEVELVGPRGKVRVDDHAAAHLFVVDESGLAAACAMVESLPSGSRSHVVAPHLDARTTPRAASEVTLTTAALPTTRARCDADRLADDLTGVLSGTRWPPLAATAGYVFGELGLTRDARGVLEALGLTETRLAVKAYWRADQANEDRGEPARA